MTKTTTLTPDVLNLVYPVGSIYMNIDAINPGTLFGGTWEQIKDTFLLSAGDLYANGSSGGEATHTLSVSEMPNHNHRNLQRYTAGTAGKAWALEVIEASATGWMVNNKIEATGGDQAHNNMPPYLVVNVWKRIA